MALLAYNYPDDVNKLTGAGLTVTMYSTATGTTLANITDSLGNAITTAVLTLDATTGLLPAFTSDQMPVFASASSTAVRYKMNPLNPATVVVLNAATATGPGTAYPVTSSQVFAQVATGGTVAPTAFNVNIEVSFDKTNWFVAGTVNNTASYTQVFIPSAAKWHRGNLTSITGGTAPTVTATVFH